MSDAIRLPGAQGPSLPEPGWPEPWSWRTPIEPLVEALERVAAVPVDVHDDESPKTSPGQRVFPDLIET